MRSDPADLLSTSFRDSARDFLVRSHSGRRLRALRNTEPGYERARWKEIAEAGWLSILIPEPHGGWDLV